MEMSEHMKIIEQQAKTIARLEAQLQDQAKVSCSPLSCSVGYSQYLLQSTTSSIKSRKRREPIVTWDGVFQSIRLKGVPEYYLFKVVTPEIYYSITHEEQEKFA